MNRTNSEKHSKNQNHSHVENSAKVLPKVLQKCKTKLDYESHNRTVVLTADFARLNATAFETYAILKPCLRDSVFLERKSRSSLPCDPTTPLDEWVFPVDAETHYQDILELTKPLRNIPVHSYNGYPGPWIENLFISRFIDRPLSYFRGMIPLFIQFVDIHMLDRMNSTNVHVPKYKDLIQSLVKILRDDCIYVTVSQDDQGITQRLHQLRPNILVLSAGGYGHIPIPLIKGELPYQSPRSFHNFSLDISFLGNTRPLLSRSGMLMELEACIRETNTHLQRHGSFLRSDQKSKGGLRYYAGKHNRWQQLIEVS